MKRSKAKKNKKTLLWHCCKFLNVTKCCAGSSKKVTGIISVNIQNLIRDMTKHQKGSVTSVAAWPVEFPTEHLLFVRPANTKSVKNDYKAIQKMFTLLMIRLLEAVPSPSSEVAVPLLSSTVEWAMYSCSLLTNTFSLLVEVLLSREKKQNKLHS